MDFRKIAIGILGALLLIAPAAAAPIAYGAFTYSSLCTEEESSDFEGLRLILVRLPLEDDVIFEWSEGALASQTADHVKLDPASGRISFHVPPDTDQPRGFSISGTLGEDAFVIDAAPGLPSTRLRLARVRDYGQDVPYCVPGTTP